jgi:hypothetical protein
MEYAEADAIKSTINFSHNSSLLSRTHLAVHFFFPTSIIYSLRLSSGVLTIDAACRSHISRQLIGLKCDLENSSRGGCGIEQI